MLPQQNIRHYFQTVFWSFSNTQQCFKIMSMLENQAEKVSKKTYVVVFIVTCVSDYYMLWILICFFWLVKYLQSFYQLFNSKRKFVAIMKVKFVNGKWWRYTLWKIFFPCSFPSDSLIFLQRSFRAFLKGFLKYKLILI